MLSFPNKSWRYIVIDNSLSVDLFIHWFEGAAGMHYQCALHDCVNVSR